MDAVILAGGKCPADVCEATGVQYRAALPIAGKAMVEWVIESVRATANTKIIVVGYEAPGCEFAKSGNNFVDSLRSGMERVTSDTFLLAAADLPFLKPDSLKDFISKTDPAIALNYPIIPLLACERQFPGMKRTTIKIREGRFTGGNVALANTELMRKIFPVLEKAYENRKRPLKLAMQVGATTLIRVALGQAVSYSLPIRTLEKSIGKFLGAPVRAIITERAEIGADVDSLQQYQQAVKLLESSRPI